MEDIHRELVEFGLKAAKAYQSEETGWIHYHPGIKEPPYQSIPFHENVLFALLLARTRTQEGVQEAKALLEKLLSYQVDGLFPCYLHDFPMTHDRFIGAKVLPPLIWLYIGFHTVLGEELSKKLKRALFLLAKRTQLEISSMPLPLQMKAIGALHSLKKHFPNEIDVSDLKKLPLDDIFKGISKDIPEDLADCLTALQLMGDKSAASFREWMKSRYHKTLKRWAGPFQRAFFSKGEPERTLFDLYMAEDEKDLRHLKGMGIHALKAALVIPAPRENNGNHLFPAMEHALIDASKALAWTNRAAFEKSHYPLSLIWGDAEAVSTFLFQIKDAKTVFFNGIDTLQIQLNEAEDGVPNDEARPLVIYLREQEGVKIFVNQTLSTTFQMGDTVEIVKDRMRIQLIFCAEEGVFFGHIAKGSLPSELVKEEKGRFSANQWLLFLRSVDQGTKAFISVKLSILQDAP